MNGRRRRRRNTPAAGVILLGVFAWLLGGMCVAGQALPERRNLQGLGDHHHSSTRRLKGKDRRKEKRDKASKTAKASNSNNNGGQKTGGERKGRRGFLGGIGGRGGKQSSVVAASPATSPVAAATTTTSTELPSPELADFTRSTEFNPVFFSVASVVINGLVRLDLVLPDNARVFQLTYNSNNPMQEKGSILRDPGYSGFANTYLTESRVGSSPFFRDGGNRRLTSIPCPPTGAVPVRVEDGAVLLPGNTDAELFVCSPNNLMLGSYYRFINNNRRSALIPTPRPTPVPTPRPTPSPTPWPTLPPTNQPSVTTDPPSALPSQFPTRSEAPSRSLDPTPARSESPSLPPMVSLPSPTLNGLDRTVGLPDSPQLLPTTGTTAFGKWDDYYFDALPANVQAAARVLGYNQTIWDNDEETETGLKLWSELTVAQKDAAFVLDYNEYAWNEDIFKDLRPGWWDAYFFEELPAEIALAATVLGFDAESWNANEEVPVLSLSYAELSPQQKDAARRFGYPNAASWDDTRIG